MDPDEPLAPPLFGRSIPAALNDMSLADLEAHIQALSAEIDRTRAHIAARSGQRAAAEHLFRPSSRAKENTP